MARIFSLLTLLAVILYPSEAAAEAPYVNSKAIKERFKNITAGDMDLLRSKKILFASRSFGLNLRNGLASLAKQDKKYELLNSYVRYDVFKNKSDLNTIPPDAFKTKNFVHFLATYWPHTKRVDEVDTLLRKEPHSFGKQVDIVVIYFHTALPKAFEHYASKMDAMQKDFPNIKFIYVTAGYMGPKQAKNNAQAYEFNQKILQRYKGKVPLYDLGAILSDDGRVDKLYCPEYSKDPADVHPNLPAGQDMMAKGFLLCLTEALKYKGGAGLAETVQDNPGAETASLKPTDPDYKAVKAILSANKVDRNVENVCVVEKGRVVELYLQEGGITKITGHIGELTELRKLHLYGDRNLKLPLLTSIDSAIGRCTKLEELLLNSNELTTLPAGITRLKNMKHLSIADNRLKKLSSKVRAWVEKHDPEGLKKQAE